DRDRVVRARAAARNRGLRRFPPLARQRGDTARREQGRADAEPGRMGRGAPGGDAGAHASPPPGVLCQRQQWPVPVQGSLIANLDPARTSARGAVAPFVVLQTKKGRQSLAGLCVYLAPEVGLEPTTP